MNQRQRVERRYALLERGTTLVMEVGESPKPVPGRLLFPILEHGSSEEDETLFERWAALLANASIRQDHVLPAFAGILSDLSPAEARLLERIFAVDIESAWLEETTRRAAEGDANQRLSTLRDESLIESLARYLRIDETRVRLLCDNLERLKLIHDFASERDGFKRCVSLTFFGFSFMEACTTHRPKPVRFS